MSLGSVTPGKRSRVISRSSTVAALLPHVVAVVAFVVLVLTGSRILAHSDLNIYLFISFAALSVYLCGYFSLMVIDKHRNPTIRVWSVIPMLMFGLTSLLGTWLLIMDLTHPLQNFII